MRAVTYHEYGAPEDVLQVQEIDDPVVADDDILVRVRAAGVHAGDRGMVRGVPYLVRPSIGISKPKETVVGSDIAGTVEAVGRNVTRFKRGDDVFGTCKGACAEYAITTPEKLELIPSGTTYEEAAAVPTSAFTALQALRDAGGLESGQKVLVIGASGGVGTFAVQIAKALGAEVTGVCSSRNVEMVRSIGADYVIDYTRDSITSLGGGYDLILDMAGNRPLSQLRSAATDTGVIVLVGGRGGPWLMGMGRVIRGLLVSPFIGQKFRFFVSMGNEKDLALLKELLESKKIRPVIEVVYSMNEGPAAVVRVDKGHAQGKVVIAI